VSRLGLVGLGLGIVTSLGLGLRVRVSVSIRRGGDKPGLPPQVILDAIVATFTTAKASCILYI